MTSRLHRAFGAVVRGAAVRLILGALVVASLASSASASGLVGTRAAHVASPANPSSAHPSSAHPPAAPSVAEATDVRVEAEATGTTLVFRLSAPLTPAAFVLANPDRGIVDLPQVDFQIDDSAGRPGAPRDRRIRRAGLLSAFRFGMLSPGRSRVVIDLAAPARVTAKVEPAGDGRYDLVIVLARTDRASFLLAARGGAAFALAPPAPASTLPGSARSVPGPDDRATIVVDPGHGGPDTGAIVKSAVEKDITLAFATKLAAKLEATGQFRVVMTRSSDVFIPLSERVRIARDAKAALMISIHADTLVESADVSGATVYTVSDRASDSYAAKVAAKENEADLAGGVDGQQDTADVNDILFDLTRQETRAYSHVFARTLVNYWKVAGRLNKNPQRAAGFVVLKAPDVPSVLLELGYLSSPVDSTDLTSEVWRDRATGRMAEAIISYFADRNGPAKAASGIPLTLRQASADLK